MAAAAAAQLSHTHNVMVRQTIAKCHQSNFHGLTLSETVQLFHHTNGGVTGECTT